MLKWFNMSAQHLLAGSNTDRWEGREGCRGGVGAGGEVLKGLNAPVAGTNTDRGVGGWGSGWPGGEH